MKLPNHDQAVIPERKVVNYLLDDSHPTEKQKAAFFKRFGFDVEKWTLLESALLRHAADHEVASTLETDEGIHYVVEGELETPDERNLRVRCVWGSDTPRFITAYPLDKGSV